VLCFALAVEFPLIRCSIRARWKLNAWQKIVEVVLIMVFITTVSFLIPICLARCRPMPTPAEDLVRALRWCFLAWLLGGLLFLARCSFA
jgi:hypothetical protein